MYCEKYRCTMDESVCIKRQKRAYRASGRGRRRWRDSDPGCINCEQGMAIRKNIKNRRYHHAKAVNAFCEQLA